MALSSENEPHADIEYRAYRIAPRDTEHAVVNTLRYVDAQGALVFCSTREAVRHLHANLRERGFSAVALSGELKQHERTTALQALRDGRARVCVATDVAARGLDMPDLGLVIHADLPQNKQALLHRSGRTGRAGRKGLSVMIVPAQHRGAAERLLASAKINAVWSAAPSADAIRARDEENLVREIICHGRSSGGRRFGSRKRPARRAQRRTTGCRSGPHSPRGVARARGAGRSRRVQERNAPQEEKLFRRARKPMPPSARGPARAKSQGGSAPPKPKKKRY